jgi:hypothetical protein
LGAGREGFQFTKQEQIHIKIFRGRARPFVTKRPGLVGDEVREKVGEYSEQGQTANAVTGKNPRSAAFVMFGSGRRLLGRRDDRGPIFHAKTSNGKIVAQVRYASRPPRDMGRQDYLDVILPPIYVGGIEKM